MSDLSVTPDALSRSRSQLSVSTYFDTPLFEREMAQLFANRPRYLGHELAVRSSARPSPSCGSAW